MLSAMGIDQYLITVDDYVYNDNVLAKGNFSHLLIDLC